MNNGGISLHVFIMFHQKNVKPPCYVHADVIYQPKSYNSQILVQSKKLF